MDSGKSHTGDIKPITMPGIHQLFLSYFNGLKVASGSKILDVGAGHGAFSKRLYEMGYDVSACDLYPEHFLFDKIRCDRVDITGSFPYADNSFDLIIAIEVMEHIADHEMFFREAGRILKQGGVLHISTPNILSLKSRVRFLLSGFFYTFKPLEMNNRNGLQHTASLTLDQYNYIAVNCGFGMARYDVDRKQATSKWLLVPLYPFIRIYTRLKKIAPVHNHTKLLLGRLLFLAFTNQKENG